MAKYTITHKCGHNEVHNIGGKVADREGQAEWLAERLCYDCYKAEQAKKREEANQINAVVNKKAGYPDLTGTEKQVAWAETIRAKVMERANDIKERSLNQLKSDDVNKQRAAKLALNTIDYFTNQNEAKWWIDNYRNNPSYSDLQDAIRDAWKKQDTNKTAEPPSIRFTKPQKAAYPATSGPIKGERQISPKRPSEPESPKPVKQTAKKSGRWPVVVVTQADIDRVQGNRSVRAIAMDEAQTSKKVRTRDDAGPWLRHPDRYDLAGVDTRKPKKQPKKQPQGRTTQRTRSNGTIKRGKRGRRTPGVISR